MAEHASMILVINTGSTSTKCSIYGIDEKRLTLITAQTISHADEEISACKSIPGQKSMRQLCVETFLDSALPPGTSLAAVGAIGGMLQPVPSGVIAIDDALARYCLESPVYHHASNLAAPIAWKVGKQHAVPAYAVDPVGVDEMDIVARISGSPLFPRFSFVHALNIRATAKKLARRLGMPFDRLRAVVCHLGGGFSIAPLANGRIFDSDNRMEAAPFTPERAGGIPPIPLLDACYSGRWSKEDLHRQLYGEGGIFAYLGTRDIRKVAEMIQGGDDFAKLVYDAMIYQICKEIGAMASALEYHLDGIILTGGVAHEPYLVSKIESNCKRLAKLYHYPGENENEAIAESVFDVLAGGSAAMAWPGCVLSPESIDPLIIHGWKKADGKGAVPK